MTAAHVLDFVSFTSDREKKIMVHHVKGALIVAGIIAVVNLALTSTGISARVSAALAA